MNRELLKIGFVGAGSIGSMFGGYLASIHTEEKPLEIIFFCRKDHRDAINRKGLELRTSNKDLLLTNIAGEFVEREITIAFNYNIDELLRNNKL